MKYKIEDQEMPLDFERLQDVLLDAINSDNKEFSIAVCDENGIQIATAIITVSGSTANLKALQLKDQLNIDNKRLLDKIAVELQQSLLQIKKQIAALSTSIVEQLTEYRELFIQYPIPHSGLRQFINKPENQAYKAVFDSFSPELAKLNTESFQKRLAQLYQIFILLEKKLNFPGENRESILIASKSRIDVKQKKIITILSDLKNLPLLVLLARGLPNFKPAAEAWEEHKKSIEDETAEKNKLLEKAFTKKHQDKLAEIFNDDERLQRNVRAILADYIAMSTKKYAETSRVEIPEFLLKHQGMRQRIIKLVKAKSNINPMEPLKHPALEELLSLINNECFLKHPTLMNLYAYECIDNYSRVQPEQDFKNYNLQYLSLDGFHLRGSTFEKANLANASLKNCKLLNTNFSGADLSGADLRGSTLDCAQWGNAKFSKETQLDWDKYGSDIILSQLKAIGQSKDLNLAQKKAEAKKCINFILPTINSNKSLLKLVELIEGKHRDYAYLREEQALWRFNQYGNTKTWSTIIGQIKKQLDKNVVNERGKEDAEKETYTGTEYKTFLKIMDEHRGRGLGPVTHSKFYEHFSDKTLQDIKSMTITKK